jgi:hypothetical protein
VYTSWSSRVYTLNGPEGFSWLYTLNSQEKPSQTLRVLLLTIESVHSGRPKGLLLAIESPLGHRECILLMTKRVTFGHQECILSTTERCTLLTTSSASPSQQPRGTLLAVGRVFFFFFQCRLTSQTPMGFWIIDFQKPPGFKLLSFFYHFLLGVQLLTKLDLLEV